MSVTDIKTNVMRLVNNKPKTIEELEGNIFDIENLYNLGLVALKREEDDDKIFELNRLIHCKLRRKLNESYEALYNMQRGA